MADIEYKKMLHSIVAGSDVMPSLSLGSELGLYDALAKLDGPATYTEIAVKANLKPMYVNQN